MRGRNRARQFSCNFPATDWRWKAPDRPADNVAPADDATHTPYSKGHDRSAFQRAGVSPALNGLDGAARQKCRSGFFARRMRGKNTLQIPCADY